MEKMDAKSLDILEENILKMKQLFPEVFTEKKIDFEKLQEILGEYIEDKEEKYIFTWNGKSKALRLSQTPSTGTLRPAKDESKNWETTQNLYIEGDNLEVLKLLQKTYHNKIKMIYIDPPYNTGKDFVYPDDYRDNIKNYLELTGQTNDEGKKIGTNSETSGRYHTDWLNMMYPRLRLARNLLSDDGVIFISIDDNEEHNLRKICDELYGEDNFVASLIWRKKTGASDSKDISVITESIIIYQKNKTHNIFSRDTTAYDENRYKLTDEYVDERGMHYIDNLDRGGISYSDSLNYPITCPDGSITYPNGRTEFLNDGWIWTWGKEKLEWGIKNGFISFKKSSNKKSGWGVYYKNYLKVDNTNTPIIKSLPFKNVIFDIINTEGTREMMNLFGSKVFQYTKPSNLIRFLIQLINNNENDIVLDFFAGSSTTAHAVMQLNAEDGGNRKFIMVQLPEPTDDKSEAYKAGFKNIAEIGKERIRRAGDKIVEDNKSKEGVDELDIGFKVFKLDTSNIKEWNPDYDNLEMTLEDMVDNFVPNRTEEDILYEIMLKYGIDLTVPIDEYEITGKKVYSIGFGILFVCLDDEINPQLIDELIKVIEELKPEKKPRIVFKDNGFKDDSIKTNSLLTLKRYGIEEVVSI